MSIICIFRNWEILRAIRERPQTAVRKKNFRWTVAFSIQTQIKNGNLERIKKKPPNQ